eukprot:4973660-Amphidinium_carterae.1
MKKVHDRATAMSREAAATTEEDEVMTDCTGRDTTAPNPPELGLASRQSNEESFFSFSCRWSVTFQLGCKSVLSIVCCDSVFAVACPCCALGEARQRQVLEESLDEALPQFFA